MTLPSRVVTFLIAGEPIPKARARVVRRKNGTVGSYTPESTASFERAVKAAARRAGVTFHDGPVGLDVVARWPYPRAWPKRARAEAEQLETTGRLTPKATRPDVDNVAKAVADALNEVAYDDDGQIAELRAVKCWGPRAETHVRIWQGVAPEWSAWWTDAAPGRAR